MTRDGRAPRQRGRGRAGSAYRVRRCAHGCAGYSLLEAELKTGRTHQIRVHLAHLGFPIAGDDKYGDFELNKALRKQGLKRMFLHARQLAFAHPANGETLDARSAAAGGAGAFLASLPADRRHGRSA